MDADKVGRDLGEAIFRGQNNTYVSTGSTQVASRPCPNWA
jgi:hypothetical protein